MQDSNRTTSDALAAADVASAEISDAERELLAFARKLSEEPSRMTDNSVERLRLAGWREPQIAEAVYIIALFAFFNRVADAFGLIDPGYRAQVHPSTTPHT